MAPSGSSWVVVSGSGSGASPWVVGVSGCVSGVLAGISAGSARALHCMATDEQSDEQAATEERAWETRETRRSWRA